MNNLCMDNVQILTPAGPAGRSLRVERGVIVAINSEPKKGDVLVDGDGGLLVPGLINAHDHLEFNTIKRLKFQDAYRNSTEWFADFNRRMESDPDIVEHKTVPLADRLLIGGLKNLLCGVTTVCHHNDLYPALKKKKFPVQVVRDYTFCHSPALGDPQASYRSAGRVKPWIIHLAEGVDDEAEAEYDLMRTSDLIQSNTVLVHGVGLTEEQRHHLIRYGGGLIWCPGSNDFLFGKTAQVGDLAQARKLALGTDSRLSGEQNLFAELKKAAATAQVDPMQIFRAVSCDAATMLRLKNRGTIAVGMQADLVLLPPIVSDPFEMIINAERSQVRLVMIAGNPMFGDPGFKDLFRSSRVSVLHCALDDTEKLLASDLAKQHRRCSVKEPGLEV